jgi:hypothetical protein
MTGVPRFQYQLDSLLKKRTAERDELLHERSGAQAEVNVRQSVWEEVRNEVDRLEQELRGVAGFGMTLDPEEQARLRVYLRDRREDAAAKQRTLDEAEQALAGIEAALRVAQESIRTLEKHRAGQRSEFEAQWRRREQGLMDELWLLHEGSKREPT